MASGEHFMRRYVTVSRSICGPVLLKFGDALNGFQWSMTESEAIRLCDALRGIIERPTQGPPQGANVVVLAMPEHSEISIAEVKV